MLRLLLPLSALAACTPSPRKAAMPSPNPIPASTAEQPGAMAPHAPGPAEQAAQGPIPEPFSAAGVAASPLPPAPPADSSAAALGRRTLSSAFVQIGPDGHLTVEQHDGHALVLRDVTMGPVKYCGLAASGARYCGGYAEIAAAWPGATLPEQPDHAGDTSVATDRDLAGR